MKARIFWMRTCKLCDGDEGIVVASEYGMSKFILDAGYNLATLMARCAISCARAGPPCLDRDCSKEGCHTISMLSFCGTTEPDACSMASQSGAWLVHML